MSAQSRRALFIQNDNHFDCSISYDINEYLIETWPTLPAKGRKSVWTLVQADEDFDFSDLEDQIDDYVYAYAESCPDWNLPDDEEQDDEEEDEDDFTFEIDLYEYYEESWSALTADQIDDVVEAAMNSDSIDWNPIFEQLDAIAAQVVSPKSNLPTVD